MLVGWFFLLCGGVDEVGKGVILFDVWWVDCKYIQSVVFDVIFYTV